MGLPAREREVAIISIVFEGTTDEIGALTGQLGRIEG
jgi:putative iron-only hydrogenase system regulator